MNALLVWALIGTASVPAITTGQSSGLAAAAAASGRPKECTSGSKRAIAKGPSVWEAARQPNLPKYCDLMARAAVQLNSQPELAKKAADEADKTLAGHAAPLVLEARAALLLGQADDAVKLFEKAQGIDARSVEDPPTMHDLAKASVLVGKRDRALATYRALVPRIDLLGTNDKRVAVLLETAYLSMSLAGADLASADAAKAKAARQQVDESIAYVREARALPATQLAGDVAYTLVLALDRAGEHEEAEAALADAQRSGAKLHAGLFDFVADADDKLALEALEKEGSDRAAAQKSWEAWLAGPLGKGGFASAAKARLAALKKGGKPAAKTQGAAPAKAPKRKSP